jgi:hypothetical protein
MPYDEEESEKRRLGLMLACRFNGWAYVHGWIFKSPEGSLHDLSAADLNQLDRISEEQLFSVSL